MVVLKILDVGDFMKKLLCSELFDSFLFMEGVLQNRMTYTFDGHLIPGYFSDEELEQEGLAGLSYLPFSMVRPKLFELIRGKRTPGYFKFSFFISPEQAKFAQFPSEMAHGYLLHLRFQEQSLVATTGVSYQTFTVDKSPDHAWDEAVSQFFHAHGIPFEKQS